MNSRTPKRSRSAGSECRLIAVGASAGGLKALTSLFNSIEGELPAIVVVIHLEPTHKSQIAGLLSRKTGKRVKEAEDGEVIQKGIIYVGPPDEHLLVSANHIQLAHSRLVRFSRPSIDVMFASVAATHGSHAVGVILSGSNRDGSDGIAAIKRAGGRTYAQEPATAEFRAMPQCAIDTGCVDFVLPLDKMGASLTRFLHEAND